MREAALKEQAAETDSADAPMVDEDVKPCVGELQVARRDDSTDAVSVSPRSIGIAPVSACYRLLS